MTKTIAPTCCDDPEHAEAYAEYDRSFERLLRSHRDPHYTFGDKIRSEFHRALARVGERG